MSVSATIQRNGVPITWWKMHGDHGVYDVTTATMVYPPVTPVTIYGVLDGYGTEQASLRSEQFGENNVELTGDYRVFTTTKLEPGDVVGFDGDKFTVVYVKAVWQKTKIVLYMAMVRR